MISKSLRITIAPSILMLALGVTGCGGGGESTPAPAAGGAGASAAPKAPPEKAKGGRLIESEANTPKRLQGRDN